MGKVVAAALSFSLLASCQISAGQDASSSRGLTKRFGLSGSSAKLAAVTPHTVSTLLAKATPMQIKGLLLNPAMGWLHKQVLIKKLGQLHTETSFVALTSIFNDETLDLRTRAAAVEALGALGDPRAVDVIGETQMHELPTVLERSMISALGQLESPWSSFLLLRYLDEEYNREHGLRAAAITALGKQRSKAAVAPLLSYLERAHSEQLQIQIVRALGDIGDKTALPTLCSLLVETRRATLQGEILSVFESIGDSSVNHAVTHLLGTASLRLHQRALHLLGTLGEASTAQHVIEAYESLQPLTSDTGFVDRSIAEFVAETDYRILLIQTMVKTDPARAQNIFLAAARPLLLSTDAASAEIMERALTRLRVAAIQALSVIRSAASTEYLVNGTLLQDNAVDVRVATATALGGLRDPRAQQQLASALQDRHPLVRLAAVKGLNPSKGQQVRELVMGMLGDEHPAVVVAALYTLEAGIDEASFTGILNVSKDHPIAEVRHTARHVVQRLSTP